MVDTRAIALQAALEPTISRWSIPPADVWIILFLSISLAALGYGLQRLRQLFYQYEFEHFKNN